MSRSRRALPPPPLVIRPILVRVALKSPARRKLLELAKFLHRKRLLTDGGVKNLEAEFTGRNETCSLSAQDVRGWGQSLVSELWIAETSEWDGLTEKYFGRYDKQKPRRPNHLQRLYLEWSPDYSWSGLLRAARSHPHLWERLEFAIGALHDDHPDRDLLSLALSCRRDLSAWDAALTGRSCPPESLVLLLGSLVHHDWGARLGRFEKMASEIEEPELAYRLVSQLACPMSVARTLPAFPDLERMARLRPTVARFHHASYLCGYRAFLALSSDYEELLSGLHTDDPIRRVRFGPRPGVNWLDCLRSELEELIELRSARSSR